MQKNTILNIIRHALFSMCSKPAYFIPGTQKIKELKRYKYLSHKRVVIFILPVEMQS